MKSKIKILFFIDSLSAGGKERRVVELLTSLNKKPEFELMVVLTSKEIHYDSFFELKIPYQILTHHSNRSLVYFFKFFRICKNFKPDIIHAWRNMQAFYSIPSSILQNIPLINNQITTGIADKKTFSKIINKLTFFWAKKIIANSHAGLEAFNIKSSKGLVIHNGVDLRRFTNLKDQQSIKQKYGIKTKYAVVMIATYSTKKNYHLYVDVAKKIVLTRDDITFIGAGNTEIDGSTYSEVKKLSESNERIILLPKIAGVEELVSACDIGVLFTYSEGFSNSIMEYMALGKPVISTDFIGGSKEIINDGINGYILESNVDCIVDTILSLINNDNLRKTLGQNGKKTIENNHSIKKMSGEFEKVYKEVLSN